ncbi:hypothetical protein SteCoe_31462 [Stentor coeruleus]|uniref:Uncharacterized protein n=1 Tax=Stentor coeruleus TaxID=5963 RepID=A0A1R2B161_9CILI|nr:hypothetical protein SteCoe_31462 [Stentor coeruleus]
MKNLYLSLCLGLVLGMFDMNYMSEVKRKDILEVFDEYDKICELFLKNFAQEDCVKFRSIGVSRVCESEPLAFFLSQFSSDKRKICLEEKELLEKLSNEVGQRRNFLEMENGWDVDELFEHFGSAMEDFPELMEVEFNYLKGDVFYDPPDPVMISRDLMKKLRKVCSDLEFAY